MFLSCLCLVITYFLASESINKEYAKKNKNLVASLIQRNHELESFSYLASHDLKQPIRTILNFTDLLQKKAGPLLDQPSTTFLNMISNSGHRLNLIVDSILKYNVIGMDRDLNLINTNNLLDGIVEDLDALIDEKNAIIKYDHLPDLVGDQAELTSLFQNLISNGLKFSHDKRIPIIEIKSKLINQHYLFSISDNGQGFDVQYVEKIFQLFQRLDNNVRGTGIGLAHCKKIVELNGGKIWAESKLEKGSTFYFTILKPNKNLVKELSFSKVQSQDLLTGNRSTYSKPNMKPDISI
jgi:light-regulated signal transduction histidine kinase (bacteriophytochrome)